ncbi:uncharacterized protein JCM6883_005914 [Sporobolomyces salmoneus]|uniref:uncharacterized protein n=1 Tax=Sporobolomyces salmoneus TaxID=183962 RepID=UPI00317DBD42
MKIDSLPSGPTNRSLHDIETTLKQIVNLLGNMELAQSWANDALKAFKETWSKKPHQDHINLVSTRLVAIRQRIQDETGKGKDVKSRDFFFAGGIIEPLEEIARGVDLVSPRPCWLHGHAVYYLVLVSTQVNDLWPWSDENHKEPKDRRKVVVKALQATQNLVNLPALNDIEEQFQSSGGRWRPHQRTEVHGEQYHRLYKILVVVRASLRNLERKGVNRSFWYLWVPNIEMIYEALKQWDDLARKLPSVLGTAGEYRLAIRIDHGERLRIGGSPAPDASAHFDASLSHHLLSSRKRSIYFG